MQLLTNYYDYNILFPRKMMVYALLSLHAFY